MASVSEWNPVPDEAPLLDAPAASVASLHMLLSERLVGQSVSGSPLARTPGEPGQQVGAAEQALGGLALLPRHEVVESSSALARVETRV
jgi:hypothetical protein